MHESWEGCRQWVIPCRICWLLSMAIVRQVHGELGRLKAEAIPTAQLTLTFVVREGIKVGERCEDFGHGDGDL